MAEPLEVLVGIQDLLRDMPERLAVVLRPSLPERMPLADTTPTPIPVSSEQAREDSTVPSRLPEALPMPATTPIPPIPLMPSQRPSEKVSLPEAMPASLPSMQTELPERMPSSDTESPLTEHPSRQWESSINQDRVPTFSPVFPSAGPGPMPTTVSTQPTETPLSSGSGMDSRELNENIKELIDAVHSLASSMMEQRGRSSTQSPGVQRQMTYQAPERQTKSSSPSIFQRMFGG